MYSRVLQVYLIDVWNPHDYPRVIWYYLCMLNAGNLNNVWYFQCNWGQYDTSRVSEGHMILYLHVRCWISEKCMMCSVYCMVIWHFKSIRVISTQDTKTQDPRPQEQRPTQDPCKTQDPRPKTSGTSGRKTSHKRVYFKLSVIWHFKLSESHLIHNIYMFN